MCVCVCVRNVNICVGDGVAIAVMTVMLKLLSLNCTTYQAGLWPKFSPSVAGCYQNDHTKFPVHSHYILKVMTNAQIHITYIILHN